MEDWQVKLQIQAMALMVEVEGMKAENTHRKDCGLSLAYCGDSFDIVAAQLNNLAHEMCNR